MKRTILCTLLLGIQCSMACAQSSITPEVLKTLQGSYTGTPAEKAMRNAISNVGISKIAVNQENRVVNLLADIQRFIHIMCRAVDVIQIIENERQPLICFCHHL